MMNYDEHPIDQIYVEWANTLDSVGKDPSLVLKRLNNLRIIDTLIAKSKDAVKACEALDVIKKHLFYGKMVPSSFVVLMEDERFQAHQSFKQDPELVRILHAVLGLITESGEFLEGLMNYIAGSRNESQTKSFLENLLEEGGDIEWYMALVAKYLGHTTLNEFLMSNKAKVTARYGDTWTQESALNRNVENEMTQLKDAVVSNWDVPATPSPLKDVNMCPNCRHIFTK